MDLNTGRRQLLTEYVKKIKRVYMPLVKFGAFSRFDIRDGQIVSITRLSQIYALLVIVMVDVFGYLVLLESVAKNLLIFPEYISLIEFMVFHNSALININFLNRHSGAEVVKNFIEIDTFLGMKKTKFMRDIINKSVLIWSGCLGIFEVSLGIVLFLTYELSTLTMVVGELFFLLQLRVCYDHVFHLLFCKFLCLRIHYLNVALVKITNLNTEYLMDQLLIYPFLWKKKYNNFIGFHTAADAKYFTYAFNMIFDQLQRVSRCYQYLIFYGIASVILSTLLAVEAIIIFIKDAELHVIRTFGLSAWFVVNWVIFVGITSQTDKFYAQIQRTKLICTYVQLKPNNSDEIFHLSRSILDVLSVRDYKIPIYDLFYFDGGLLRSIATSVFLYITIQLQIAFPKRFNHDKENVTLS